MAADYWSCITATTLEASVASISISTFPAWHGLAMMGKLRKSLTIHLCQQWNTTCDWTIFRCAQFCNTDHCLSSATISLHLKKAYISKSFRKFDISKFLMSLRSLVLNSKTNLVPAMIMMKCLVTWKGIQTTFRDNVKESAANIFGYNKSKRISSPMKHWISLKLVKQTYYKVILMNTETLSSIGIRFSKGTSKSKLRSPQILLHQLPKQAAIVCCIKPSAP